MKILLAMIAPRRVSASSPTGTLLETYMERSGRYSPVSLRVFADEAALLDFVEESAGRTRVSLVLTDSRGKQWSSEEFAEWMGGVQDRGVQQMVVAIGPANGWSPAAINRADLTVAFGRITLPHELAAVVAAEQIYRALTIRAGHPYHGGH